MGITDGPGHLLLGQADGAWTGLSPKGLTIRAVLAVGFGLTAAIWLLAWYSSSAEIARLEAETQQVSARYLQAQERISAARAAVYQASILARDALLAAAPPSERDRETLAAAYATADQALADYRPVQARDNRDRIDRLRDEIGALRAAMTALVTPGDQAWSPPDRARLLDEIRPRRDAALRIANDLQALNRHDFMQHQQSTTVLYRNMQRRFTNSLALALLGSLGIALFAGLQVRRLERRLQQQRGRDLQHQLDLQRLSAKLIHAQEEERRSIARELHDEVGQVLTAVKVELAVAEHALADAGHQVASLEDARAVTDRALHAVRDLSRLLHPALLDDMGLPAALDWYLKGFRRRHGLSVDYEATEMTERLAPEIEASAYRIVQEALTNVVRHAGTNRCSVTIVHANGAVRLTVADHGVGFDPAALPTDPAERGLGLVGIRERAWYLGGSAKIASAVGRGTTLTVVLPARPRVERSVASSASEAGTGRSALIATEAG